MTTKSQALGDSINELTETILPPSEMISKHWKMYFDGSLNIKGARARVYFITPFGDKLRYVLKIHFKAPNNITEYEATIQVCA